MFIIRPVEEKDWNDICELAAAAQSLTTLPNDKTILKNKIFDSLKAFHPHISKPGGEAYLFVLENTETKKVIGTSGILSKTGGFEPFYTYQIQEETYESKNPAVHKIIPTLHLLRKHNGPSELYGLFLHPNERKHGLGKLLSLSRLLFVKNFRKRFDDKVISELRGVTNKDGKSPFWEAIGKTFFEVDFYTADFLSGTGNKQFIEDLMPEFPIYIPLLPYEVQSVIGEVHENTKPARALLEKQGFVYKKEVDIFDAGPTLEAELDNVAAIKQTQKTQIKNILPQLSGKTTSCLISNLELNFRCCQSNLQIHDDKSVSLDEITAKNLNLKAGDTLFYYAL